MIKSLFKDTITIKRKVEGSQDSLGEKSNVESAIYTNIPARIEKENKTMEYNKAGSRIMNRTIIYLQKNYIALERDLIFQNGSQIGIVETVVPAYGVGGNKIDHYELFLENE